MLMLAADVFVFLIINGVIWLAFVMLSPLLPLPEPLLELLLIVVMVVGCILCQLLLGLPVLFRGR